MCARFKSKGIISKPGDEIILETPEGEITGVWTSFAQEEKIDWWLRRAGNTLAQCPVDEIAERADDTRELRWSKAPAGASLLFVVSPEIPGKIRPYRPARVITRLATPEEIAYFRHPRFPHLGEILPTGEIQPSFITAPVPVPSDRPVQTELFFG